MRHGCGPCSPWPLAIGLEPMGPRWLAPVDDDQTGRRGGAACGRRPAGGLPCATADEDLARLAALTADWPAMSGGATVAGFCPQVRRARGDLPAAVAPAPIPGVEGPGVVLAGSCADRTRERLDRFEAVR